MVESKTVKITLNKQKLLGDYLNRRTNTWTTTQAKLSKTSKSESHPAPEVHAMRGPSGACHAVDIKS